MGCCGCGLLWSTIGLLEFIKKLKGDNIPSIGLVVPLDLNNSVNRLDRLGDKMDESETFDVLVIRENVASCTDDFI